MNKGRNKNNWYHPRLNQRINNEQIGVKKDRLLRVVKYRTLVIVARKEINIFQSKEGYQYFIDWKDNLNPVSAIMIQLWVVSNIYNYDYLKIKKEKIYDGKRLIIDDQW